MPEIIPTDKPTRYSPQQTQDIRKAAVADVLNAQTDLLKKADQRTDISDLGAVKAVVEGYIATCARVGICPNLEGVFAQLGISRSYGYRYIRENPDSDTALYLGQIRLMMASARMSLSERGLLDNAMSIFILKNSGLNFADRHELEIDQVDKDTRPEWARGMSEEKYVQELLAAIPEPLDDV